MANVVFPTPGIPLSATTLVSALSGSVSASSWVNSPMCPVKSLMSFGSWRGAVAAFPALVREGLVQPVGAHEWFQPGQHGLVLPDLELALRQKLVGLQLRVVHIAPQVFGVRAPKIGEWHVCPECGRPGQQRGGRVVVLLTRGLASLGDHALEPMKVNQVRVDIEAVGRHAVEADQCAPHADPVQGGTDAAG